MPHISCIINPFVISKRTVFKELSIIVIFLDPNKQLPKNLVAFISFDTYGLVVAPDVLTLSCECLDLPLGDAQLVKGDLKLALNLIVMCLDFGKGEGLFLDGLLEINVGLVGDIQRHFQFSDLNLELLLDAGDLRSELGLGFDYAGAELFNLDAGLFAAKKERILITHIWQMHS